MLNQINKFNVHYLKLNKTKTDTWNLHITATFSDAQFLANTRFHVPMFLQAGGSGDPAAKKAKAEQAAAGVDLKTEAQNGKVITCVVKGGVTKVLIVGYAFMW